MLLWTSFCTYEGSNCLHQLSATEEKAAAFSPIEVEISFYLLRRLLGVKTSEGAKQAKVQKLQKQEILMVNIGSTATGGKVLAVKADLAKILLTQPVCTTEGEKIALSRRVDKHWRLIGWGQIRRGARVEVAAAAQ